MFKVAAVQTCPKYNNLDCNLKKVEGFIRKAALKGAKIVCLPEVFDTGYFLKWIRKNVEYTSKITQTFLSDLSHELKIYVIGSYANKRGASIYNSSFLFSPSGKIINRYDKYYLFRAKPQEEHKYFKEGRGIQVAQTKYGKIGFAICNDIRHPNLFLKQSKAGVKIIFVSSAWSELRLSHWKTLLVARSLENQAYIVAANQTNSAGELAFASHSRIIDFDGNILAEKKQGEGIIISSIDYKALEKKRRELPTFAAQ